MQHFEPTQNLSWQLGYRGRVAVFIDGNNLFHAARFHNIDIDYNKLLRVLLGDGRLLRAFFYTGVDVGAERQQGFLLWMRRNGFRVVHKELKTFYDGTRKANLDVEIAVDMLSLAGRYETAVLVSGDEDFVYAVNAVAYKGCRVEVAGFRSNTAPKLIDVADYFIDLGEIADKVRKEHGHNSRFYEQHIVPDEAAAHAAQAYAVQPDVDGLAPPPAHNNHQPSQQQPARASAEAHAARVLLETEITSTLTEEMETLDAQADFIRVTDDH